MSKRTIAHFSFKCAHRIYTRSAISIIYSQAEHFEAHRILHTWKLCGVCVFAAFVYVQYFVGSKQTHQVNMRRRNNRKKWTVAHQPLCVGCKQIARKTCNCLFFLCYSANVAQNNRIQSWLMSNQQTNQAQRERERMLQKKIIPIAKSFIYFFSYFLCFIQLIAKLLKRCVNLTLNLLFLFVFFLLSVCLHFVFYVTAGCHRCCCCCYWCCYW